MTKKISLEMSDGTYENLLKIACNFGLDYKQTIDCILKSVSAHHSDIARLTEMPNVNADLPSILGDALENYPRFAYSIREFLTKLKAKGPFSIDAANVEWDIEKDCFSVILCPDSSDYNFYMINVMKKNGVYNLGTYTTISIEETKEGSFDRLVEVAEAISCPFDVDDYSVDAGDCDEERCSLSIEYWADSLEYLPSLKEADRFIKQIFKQAKVTRKQ